MLGKRQLSVDLGTGDCEGMAANEVPRAEAAVKFRVLAFLSAMTACCRSLTRRCKSAISLYYVQQDSG